MPKASVPHVQNFDVLLCAVTLVFRGLCGVVWCGVVWCGVVWCGVVWCGVVWCGICRGEGGCAPDAPGAAIAAQHVARLWGQGSTL
jgi:hypothetical protein